MGFGRPLRIALRRPLLWAALSAAVFPVAASAQQLAAAPAGKAAAAPIAEMTLKGDQARTRQHLQTLLAQVGYQVELAGSGGEALVRFGLPSPDAVLLDPALPDIDGLDLCQQLRNQSTVAIVCISPASEEARTVAALDRGADDYVTEACSPVEFLARLRAAIRRAVPTAPFSHCRPGALGE